MEMKELTSFDEILGIYDVYRHCMYMPTVGKFRKKVADFLEDERVRVFALWDEEIVKGAVAVSLKDGAAEIKGISVDEKSRSRGMGSCMIKTVIDTLGLKKVYAETDDDAVGFYIKNGFRTERFTETYDGEEVIRYRCERNI